MIYIILYLNTFLCGINILFVVAFIKPASECSICSGEGDGRGLEEEDEAQGPADLILKELILEQYVCCQD